MRRDPGFYWVLVSHQSDWIVAEFNERGTWSFCGYDDIVMEEELGAIDETRLRHVNDE